MMGKTIISWIELGNTGIPVSKILLRKGYPLTVYDRTANKEKERMNAGAQTAESQGKAMQRKLIYNLLWAAKMQVTQRIEKSNKE